MPAQVVLSEDFNAASTPAPWTYEPRGVATGTREPVGGSVDDHCVTASSGVWRSPSFPVTAFQYYRLTCRVKALGKCYWSMHFYSSDGQELAADHYNCFDMTTDWMPQESYILAPADATSARFALTPIKDRQAWIDDVRIETGDRARAAEWADGVSASMPALAYSAPADRWEHAGKTMAGLRAGKTLRVVMLGDSIVNDTANSAYDVRIERMYPGSRWIVVHSVRGSTGCATYKQDGRVQGMVIDRQPDLLMIGGISNGDAESVRTVIRQVRDALPDLEIVVMSGAIGRINPLANPDWEPEPQPGEYRTQLAQVAADEGCEFIDMETIWGTYIKHSGRDWDSFTRDELHGNSRGRQVLAQVLEAYFSPKQP